MIGILNYGLGNIKAFFNIYKNLGIEVFLVNNNNDFSKASKLILPGVGTFDNAILKLKNSCYIDTLEDYVLSKRMPILGVCVGMQIMADSSEEGNCKGLGWISGIVKKFNQIDNISNYRFPHMGWNTVDIKHPNSILFKDLNNPEFYFLHSYYCVPNNNNHEISQTNFTLKFASAISKENIFATQFHPEKSHLNGVKLLKNFSEV